MTEGWGWKGPLMYIYDTFPALQTVLGLVLVYVAVAMSPYCKSFNICLYADGEQNHPTKGQAAKERTITHLCLSMLLLSELSLASLPPAPPYVDSSYYGDFVEGQRKEVLKIHDEMRK